jgi:hypothetical protein
MATPARAAPHNGLPMLDLYLSELRRFRNSAAIYAAASLLVLILLGQLVDIATAPRELHQVMLILAMLSGLGFAAYQFGTYRQPSRWIWLQHRPLHRARILAAIALASVTLVVLAMALPLFVALAAQDLFTYRVIDQRHYAGAAYLALSALSAWLVGAYIVLHRSRWAFVILVLPILLTMHLAEARTVLALSLLCNALLLLLVYTVFRPNRHTANDAAATIGTAVPLQAGFYLALLWAGSTLFQVGQMLAGVHPLSSEHAARGGLIEAVNFDAREAIQAGLAGAADPRAPAWKAALTEKNTANAGPDLRQFAVRNPVTTVGTIMFVDHAQNAWTFSHDRMMYSGLNLRTHAFQGWYGARGLGDTGAFDSQPVPLRDNRGTGYLANAHDLYQLLGTGRELRHVLHVMGAEQLGGGIAVLGGRMAVLTNRRLVILEGDGPLPSVVASIALPLPFGDLERTDVAQIADGMLVSLVYGHRRLDGVAGAPQLTYLVNSSGQVRQVARRELAHDFHVLFEHKDWWLSPVLHALVNLPAVLVDKGIVPDDGVSRFEPLTRERPAAAWMAAIVAALVAAAGAAWWTRRSNMPPRARAAWCAACLLLGFPALLSLMVLRPREQSVAAAATRAAPLTPI